VQNELLVQGRCVRSEEIAWLREWIQRHGQWSRKRLARQLCERWDWRDGCGRLKDFAARSLLLKLETQGHIQLPPLQMHKRRAARPIAALADWRPPPCWSASLTEIVPVSVEPVAPGSLAARRWAFYLQQYHYLGLRVVGENLGYLATDAYGREVACLLFGAPAWRCAPRDQFVGWSDETRRQRLHTVANNTRFLMLPWVSVPCLASHVLSQAVGRIGADWQAKYAHGLDWLETFVQRERFAGTCYRAANWQWVGQTTSRSRQDREHTRTVAVKDIYLYGLGGRSR
jgi:Domain of unknown function (DUF4338)